ncbi:MAG: enoyl-CoA hydratase-related protein [Candidatus Binatus sp.]|jgi:enoyl-CoA hydratase/carnithine racemase|uniref:enoyl-CoA hydratase/isomerase family protein n=1 Tax=Candidatus Binatus sp. TaxID=2811406 RepID=UPI003C928145
MSVDLSVENGLAEIVLNRPDKRNAFNDAMASELNACLERAASRAVRAMMIRGEGKSVCGTVRKKGISGRCVSIRCETGPFPAPLEAPWTKTG